MASSLRGVLVAIGATMLPLASTPAGFAQDRDGGAATATKVEYVAPPAGSPVTAPLALSTPLIGLHADHFEPGAKRGSLVEQVGRDGVPRQPKLSARERAAETAFAEWIEEDPERAADAALLLAGALGSPDQPVFEVDGIKRLVPEYGSGVRAASPEEYTFRLEHNHALHPAAVLLARLAFIDRLDELAALPAGDPLKRVFVTNGGCAAGKGSLTDIVKNALGDKAVFGAVWDAAGEGDALENDWILRAATERGIDVVFGYAQADPVTRYEGVLIRGEDFGRVVDVMTFVNSYADGARVFRDFLASEGYRRAVAEGRAMAFGIDPGEFDLASLEDKSKPAFPNLRDLNPRGTLTPEDLAPPPDKLTALEASLGILEAHVAKVRADGKDPLPVARGALENAIKFLDGQPAEIREAILSAHERIFGE